MDTSTIINGMSSLKTDYISVELNKVYSDIYDQVSTASADIFANLFTSLESKAIISFYVKLEEEIRQCAYTAMRSAGILENEIPMVWITARNAAPAPKAQLCNEGNYTPPQTAAPQEGEENEIPKENSRKPKFGHWILISGVAVEILSWVFVPSNKLWAPIIRDIGLVILPSDEVLNIARGIGLALIGAGAYKTYQEIKRPAKIPLTKEAKEMLQQKAMGDVKEICDAQRDLNIDIYCNWVDGITSAILKECDAIDS